MSNRSAVEIPEMKVWVDVRDYCPIHVFDNKETADRYCEAQNNADLKEHNGAFWHGYQTQEFDVEHD